MLELVSPDRYYYDEILYHYYANSKSFEPIPDNDLAWLTDPANSDDTTRYYVCYFIHLI